MTEADLMQAAQSVASNAIAIFAVYITVLGAYLVTAYTIGAKLTPLQLIIVNGLFVVFSALSIWSVLTTFLVAESYFAEIYLINPNRGVSSNPEFIWIGLVINSLAALACMLFMWDVRKSSREERST